MSAPSPARRMRPHGQIRQTHEDNPADMLDRPESSRPHHGRRIAVGPTLEFGQIAETDVVSSVHDVNYIFMS